MSTNLLLKKPKYKITRTATGVIREYLYENGHVFRDYRSNRTLFGMPLIAKSNGRDPETGRWSVAHGFIAIGQRAKGVIAIGQFSRGVVAIGQFSAGAVVGIGQFAIAPMCVGQFALGYVAAGQMGAAILGIFQSGAVLWGITTFFG